MKMRKNIIPWGIFFLVLLLLASLSLLPSFIDSSSLKQKIQTAVIQQNIGEIDYEKLYLSLMPLPHLTIENFYLSAHAKVTARVETMQIYPELMPLFFGQIRFSKIILDAPEIKAALSDEIEKKEDIGKEPESFDLPTTLANAIAPLIPYISGLKVSMSQGHIQLNQGEQEKLLIKDIDLNAKLTIASPRFFKLQLKIGGGFLTVNPQDQKVVINCDNLNGEVQVDKEQVRFILNNLTLTQPSLQLSGQFRALPDAPEFILELNGKDVDVNAIRAVALGLEGNNTMVRDIFSYVQGGSIPVIHVQSKSKTMAALGDMDNLTIQGRMRNGDISIENIGLELTGVDGEVLISKGLLNASGASASLGETTGRNGSMRIGLADDNDTFHLDIMLDADLQQLPSVLRKIVDHEPFLHELSLIKNLNGSGKARLVLGEHLGGINTKLEVSEIDFSADYQRIPFPINISGGKLFFAENTITIKDLDGSVGKSVFSATSCNVEWENNLRVDLPAGRLNLDLGELYPWISSFDALHESLADVKEVKGHVELSTLQLSGPHDINDTPEQWQLSASGEVKKVFINSRQLPEILHLSSGKIQVTPNQLSFRNLNAQLMDAQFDLTGTLQGDISRPARADVFLNGDLGEKAIHFLSQSGYLPSAYAVHAPVQFADTNVKWQSAGDVLFKGNVIFPKGASLFTDFQYKTGDYFTINRLDIQDQESKASLVLDLQKKKIAMAFNGFLHNKTLDRIFVAEKLSDSWLEGDLKVVFVKDRFSESTFKGQLEGGNFIVPATEEAPLFIDKLLLAGNNNGIEVSQLSLSHLENRVDVNGRVNMTDDTVMLDLEASAGDLKWDMSEKTSKEPAKIPAGNSGIDFWEYPVSGIINLAAKSFSVGEYKWEPVHAKISREQGKVKVEVIEANLCGIDTLGTLRLDGDILDLDFQYTAKNRDISFTYDCLSKKQIDLSGLYKLSGQIKARGPADELLLSAKGSIDFEARNGVIAKDKRLSRILEVINFTEIVKGRIPDLTSEGFSYKTIIVQGDFENNMMIFKNLYMDGQTLDLLGKGTLDLKQEILDVELLAAPFKTVDTAIKFIPGVNYLMAGNLVSIPIRVRGNRFDPEVSIMSPADISSSFLDFAERTIKSPIKVIKNLNPYKKSEQE